MLTRRSMLAGTAFLLAGGGTLAYVLWQRNFETVPAVEGTSSVPKTTEERLTELLAKEQLTPAEMEEFVELQNKRILEPQRDKFVSKHRFSKCDMAARLQAIDWFANCGKPVKLDLTMPVVQVANWKEAVVSCDESVAETCRLQARNQLSGWLHVHAHSEFQEWNDRVDEHKRIVDPFIDKHWKPFFESRNLPDKLLYATRWNIMSALMEESYLDTGHRCFFFHELLLVYEAGHFPCGWVGEWPEGKLVVY